MVRFPKILGRPVRLIIIGFGERGRVYSQFCLDNPSLAQIVGVAEPSPRRRLAFQSRFPSVPSTHIFSSWEELVQTPRLADAAVICTLDTLHAPCVVSLARLRYAILCEKPMAVTPSECAEIVRAVKEEEVMFAVCHVLRYSPYNLEVKRVIESGEIGEVVNVVHVEPVGWWHFAHSYVRGNWRREVGGVGALMAKSCHDLDILCHYFSLPPLRVSSFGSLTHFQRSSKPIEAGTATRCVSCAYEPSCPYSAPRLYLNPSNWDTRHWPASVLVDSPPDIEDIRTALSEGDYGRCVYECDNDVVDHQVVNIEFERGRTASFTMVAFTGEVCERQTRIHGSKGMVVGDSKEVRVTSFLTGQTKIVSVSPKVEGVEGSEGGHGGGDYGLMKTFVECVRNGDPTGLGCTPRQVLRSHGVVFAAEEARKKGKVVDVREYLESVGGWV